MKVLKTPSLSDGCVIERVGWPTVLGGARGVPHPRKPALSGPLGWLATLQRSRTRRKRLRVGRGTSTHLCRVHAVLHRVLGAPLVHRSPVEVELLQAVVVFQGAAANSWKMKPVCVSLSLLWTVVLL